MSEYNPESSKEENEAYLQLDLYGCKAKAKPTPSSEEDPATWGEVWVRVKASLMSLSVQPLELLVDTFKSVRSTVRGIGALPSAVATRVEGAHKIAERVEGKAQAQLSDEVIVGDQALLEVLAAYRARGISAELREGPDGTILMAIVPPDRLEPALEAGAKALLPKPESVGKSGSEDLAAKSEQSGRKK